MPESGPTLEFTVHLPAAEGLDQDTEWCIVQQGTKRRRIRFHDYQEIFRLPGLYEHLFYDRLKCTSPRTIRELIAHALEDRGAEPDSLRVIDVGAGNGMVGEELAELGVSTVVGVDIIQEAADATARDRPGVYDDYRVVDLTDVPADDDQFFRDADFTGMTSVAALGFGDIPPRAFGQAYSYVRPGGAVAFTIKEDFLSDADPTGFNLLIRRMFDSGVVRPVGSEHRYQHRLSVTGDPLYYLAYVVDKMDDIPADWLAATPRP